MQLIKIIRATEWWEYKFPPILVAAYLIFAATGSPLSDAIVSFLLILSSLIIGAVYVSVLNDATDVKADMLAGKQNRMSSFSPAMRIIFVCIPLLIAAGFCWYIRDNQIAMAFYIACYIAFTLYSIPPFRLKTKGFSGLVADASGSQMFPTLYAAAMVSGSLNYQVKTSELLLLGIWSFCFGLRGILWHQFHDLKNDIKSGLSTWAQKLSNKQINLWGAGIIIVELVTLSCLLASFDQYLCFVILALYGLYLWWRLIKTNVEVVLFKYTDTNYCIFMNEYYQVFLPATILIVLSIQDQTYILLLLLHILIFPMGFKRVAKNILRP